MRASTLLSVCFAVAVPLSFSCRPVQRVKQVFQKPDLEPVRTLQLSSIPLGYAASIAMSAIQGETIPGVTLSQSCSTFPCNTIVYIDVDSTGVVPVGVGATQTAVVAGLWESDTLAFLSMFFTDYDGGAPSFTIANVNTVPVTVDSGRVRIVYAMEDVNAGSDTVMTVTMSDSEMNTEMTRLDTRPPVDSSVTVDQEAWIVDVDRNGTPGVLTDDTYSVSGGGQFVEVGGEEAYILQVTSLFTQTSSGCFRNPADGMMISRNTGVTSSELIGTKPLIGTVVFTFHASCDGRVDVPVATGVYATSTQKSFDLNLAAQ